MSTHDRSKLVSAMLVSWTIAGAIVLIVAILIALAPASYAGPEQEPSPEDRVTLASEVSVLA